MMGDPYLVEQKSQPLELVWKIRGGKNKKDKSRTRNNLTHIKETAAGEIS